MTEDAQARGYSRNVSLDRLRVLASFSVVVLHLSGQNWGAVEVTAAPWQVFNLYDGAVRWAVPVFVMISGALFLDPARGITIKTVFRKYILRIVCAFIFWAGLYAVKEGLTEGFHPELVRSFIAGHYHMWFLLMMAGLYLIIPLVRRITADREATKYFLVLCLVFTFLLPRLLSLDRFLRPGILTQLLAGGRSALDTVDLHFTLGFTAYFVLGHYLSRNSLPPLLVWCCGVLGFAGTIGLSAAVSLWAQEPSDYFYNSFSVPVLLESVFVFCSATKNARPHRSAKLDRAVRLLSEYSFGVYLVHPMVIEILSLRGITTLSFFPSLSVPLLAAAVYAISALISALMHRIPILKKYVV